MVVWLDPRLDHRPRPGGARDLRGAAGPSPLSSHSRGALLGARRSLGLIDPGADARAEPGRALPCGGGLRAAARARSTTSFRLGLSKLMVVVCVALVGWIAIRAVDMGAGRYLQRFRVDVEDNLLARKHITQVRVFKRVADTLIIIIATATALDDVQFRPAIRGEPVCVGRRRRPDRRPRRPPPAEQPDRRRADRRHPADPDRRCGDRRERVGLDRGDRLDLCGDPAVGLAADGGPPRLLHRKAVPELDPRRRRR